VKKPTPSLLQCGVMYDPRRRLPDECDLIRSTPVAPWQQAGMTRLCRMDWTSVESSHECWLGLPQIS
jgi:hypothetical protein